MTITSLKVKNFRSIADLNLNFSTFYSALCGKNDAGKTNVVKALRVLLGEDDPFSPVVESELSLKNDLPKWLGKDSKDKCVTIEASFAVDDKADEGLFRFLVDYLALAESPSPLNVKVSVNATIDKPEGFVSLSIDEKQFESLKAQEVLKKLQSSHVAIFHNSTSPEHPYIFQRRGSYLGELSSSDSELIESAKEKFNTAFGKLVKRDQKELSGLLGRLNEKYEVGLSVQKFDPTYLPIMITLGTKGMDVPLENWGSGTQNRTLILLALFRAKKISQAQTSASKITPFLVVEEPESFLHPAAQAEFGSIIQELSQEFKVQVIVTTHSPYMLSQEQPSSNMLLSRHIEKSQVRDTRLADTSDENWMEPFGLALGLDNSQFGPWREALFSKNDKILMVEGETDKEYFRLLQRPEHGENRLKFSGEIFSYGGKDTLKQKILVKFIRDKYKKCFVTYDLDADSEISQSLSELGFQKSQDYLLIGVVVQAPVFC